jgi:hypothetical protein
MKYLIICAVLMACGTKNNDTNDLGVVTYLPKGEYIIWNTGSRHIVKCLKTDGTYYWLNDAYFSRNGIEGYDAHQYHYKTKVIIK